MKLALFLSFFTSLSLANDFHVMAPTDVARLLESQGLNTRGYRLQEGDSSYRASSPYKEIGNAFPLANNLAYYISGEAKKVTQMKLVLNVNDPKESSEAISSLAAAIDSLLRATLEDPPIEEVLRAVRSSKSGEWLAKDTMIRVLRVDWPTGRGYELQLIIE